MNTRTARRHFQGGFSLIEMLTVVAILTLVMGAVFRQIITAQKRYRAEEAKLDITQESREFLDQMVRDLHQIGYPTQRIYATTAVPFSPDPNNDHRVAAGLVKYAYDDLWFEGDVDGDGVVEVVEYKLLADADGKCPCSLQRRQQVPKVDGAPLTQTGSSSATELQNVVNSGGAYTISGTGPGGVSNDTFYGSLKSPYIFRAFDAKGALVSPPLDLNNDPQKKLATIRSIRITINVLVQQGASDLQTGRRSAVSMTATARISN